MSGGLREKRFETKFRVKLMASGEPRKVEET
jgi:hypothetical protein